jgi:hypothetical protein
MNSEGDTAAFQSGAGLYRINCKDKTKVILTELDMNINSCSANQVILLNGLYSMTVS